MGFEPGSTTVKRTSRLTYPLDHGSLLWDHIFSEYNSGVLNQHYDMSQHLRVPFFSLFTPFSLFLHFFKVKLIKKMVKIYNKGVFVKFYCLEGLNYSLICIKFESHHRQFQVECYYRYYFNTVKNYNWELIWLKGLWIKSKDKSLVGKK